MAIFKLFNTKQISDEELVKKYAQTKNIALVGELYQKYTHLIYAIAFKYFKNEQESEDIVMDVFEKLTEDLQKHQIENFKSWLHTYVRNFCLMKIRKEKSQFKHNEKIKKELVETELSSHQEEVEERNKLEMNLDKLGEALQQLKSEQRECVQLFYIDGLSYQNIVEKTGFDYKSVKSHIQNGKRNLQNMMSK